MCWWFTIGRAKSEHAGHLAAFDSQLTIVHAEHVAVFTVNNGPLYIGRYLHLALHFLILDYVIASNNRTLRSAVISSGSRLSWLGGTGAVLGRKNASSEQPPPQYGCR